EGELGARQHDIADLRVLDADEERQADEAGNHAHEPARRLRHALDQQHARHQREARKVPFEDRAFCRHLAKCLYPSLVGHKLDEAVDHLKLFETHRLRQAFLAATSPSMRAQRFLSTKYSSVVALPSFTSCVHCSSGSLMPNALSMAKAMSRKSRLSMPRSSIAWLSGLIVSRGMSHVSAMILATVSNVEDIA